MHDDALASDREDHGEMEHLLKVLEPVEAALAEALATGDKESALEIARKALEAVGEALRPPDLLPDDRAWMQALVLDFEPRPLIALADATLTVHDGFGLRIGHWSGLVEADAALDLASRFVASLHAGCAGWYLLDAGKP